MMMRYITQRVILLVLLLSTMSVLIAVAQPHAREEITIGNGANLARVPVDMYYKTSYFQMLIFPSEINDFTGLITGLKFYNNFVSDLQGKHTKIWIQTTSQSTLSSGWIALSEESSLVYDGNMYYPAGTNQITFPFIHEYTYFNNQNLLITIQRPMDEDYHSMDDRFQVQTIGSNRARNYQSDYTEMNPFNPDDSGSVSGTFPMTTLLTIPILPASVSGVVTHEGSALGGVQIELQGTEYQSQSDADGEYLINHIQPGNYVLRFSKIGYATHTQEITLNEDDALQIDVSMDLASTITLSGRVLASDTAAGLEGAFIAINGTEPYAANSDENGYFEIEDVYGDQPYNYTIMADGYTGISGELELGNVDYDMGDLTLNELSYPPQSVSAILDPEETMVTVSWSAPAEGQADWAPSLAPHTRALEGYEVYRLRLGQEDDLDSWILLTDEILPDTTYIDEDWLLLLAATYRWAVKTIYTNGVSSLATISNSITQGNVTGMISGFVITAEGDPIPGATITAGEDQSSTEDDGSYLMIVPVGVYTVSFSAPSYHSLDMENVVVQEAETTVLNVILQPTSVSDLVNPAELTAITGIHPNPFNPETTIYYKVDKAGPSSLEIHNIRGQKVRTLHRSFQQAGVHSQVFDGLDDNGAMLGSGIYFCVLRSSGNTDTRKMVLSK